MDINTPEFQEAFMKDLGELERGQNFKMEFSASALLAVIGQLQLALRHPGNRGHSALLVSQIVAGMIREMGRTEVLRQGLMAGVDPRHDQPTPAAAGSPAPVRPTVVTLCGSTRFKAAFIEANFRETMCGRVVLSVGLYGHADAHVYKPTEEEKKALDELHFRKIDMSDEILVLDVYQEVCRDCGKHSDDCSCPMGCEPIVKPYIGTSTRNEIAYAQSKGKRVRYLSQEK